MKKYAIPMVPGPTTVPRPILETYLTDYGSADLEPEYMELYADTQVKLQQILDTKNQMAIMTGEGMVALWGALKSCLKPGDRVLAVATGEFGYGLGDMARQIGAEVETVGFDYDATADPARVEQAIRSFHPKMVTAVHCETPSGTLNPVDSIGAVARAHDVPLFYVDAVSSAGGTPLHVDGWGIDLCLVGSQKCLSAPPDMAVVSISERAWKIIDEVAYSGYDALKPWRTVLDDRWFPYTPSWHSTAALNVACQLLLDEGLDRALQRHADVAARCRKRLGEIGLEIYPRREQDSAPTVTAVKVPESIGWPELDRRLRQRGVVFGGSLGPLSGKVFRIGHMGAQADPVLIDRALDGLAEAIRQG